MFFPKSDKKITTRLYSSTAYSLQGLLCMITIKMSIIIATKKLEKNQ